MTVAVNTNAARAEYSATAGQTIFTYPFRIFTEADLVVSIDGTSQNAGTDFTVTGFNNPSGGTFTFASGLTIGQVVVAYRSVAVERTTDFQPNGPLPASALNNEFDRQIIIAQDNYDAATTGVIRINVAEAGADVDTLGGDPSTRAGKILSFDSGGNPEATVLLETLAQQKADAETGAATATTKAAEASTSASNASTSVSNASFSSSNAATKATESATSADEAAASADEAAASAVLAGSVSVVSTSTAIGLQGKVILTTTTGTPTTGTAPNPVTGDFVIVYS